VFEITYKSTCKVLDYYGCVLFNINLRGIYLKCTKLMTFRFNRNYIKVCLWLKSSV